MAPMHARMISHRTRRGIGSRSLNVGLRTINHDRTHPPRSARSMCRSWYGKSGMAMVCPMAEPGAPTPDRRRVRRWVVALKSAQLGAAPIVPSPLANLVADNYQPETPESMPATRRWCTDINCLEGSDKE